MGWPWPHSDLWRPWDNRRSGFLAFLGVMAAAAVRAFRKEFKGGQTMPKMPLWSREFWMFVGLLAFGPWSRCTSPGKRAFPVFNLVLGTVRPAADLGRSDATGLGDFSGRFGPARLGTRHRLGTDLPRGSGAPCRPHFFAHRAWPNGLSTRTADIKTVVVSKLIRALCLLRPY